MSLDFIPLTEFSLILTLRIDDFPIAGMVERLEDKWSRDGEYSFKYSITIGAVLSAVRVLSKLKKLKSCWASLRALWVRVFIQQNLPPVHLGHRKVQ